jgi:hypothetical protein
MIHRRDESFVEMRGGVEPHINLQKLSSPQSRVEVLGPDIHVVSRRGNPSFDGKGLSGDTKNWY